MRRLLVLLILLASCGVAQASEYPTTLDHETTTTHQSYPSTVHETTTTMRKTTTEYPTTTQHHETTTVYPTTSTVRKTTTTARETTTAHETTTTRKATTTTAAATTTTKAGTTTTTVAGTTTTTEARTTTTAGGGGGTTTTLPKPSLFSIPVAAVCPPNGVASLSITFGNRPDLDGMTGILRFDGGSPTPLVFQSNTTVVIPWPEGLGTIGVVTYTVNGETATAGPVEFPEGCVPTTTTTVAVTTTTGATTSTTTSSPPSSTTASSTTTTSTSLTTTTLPDTFVFNGAATVCIKEVPTITITFGNTFPQLAGVTGTLTMSDINGNVVSVQPLVYQPGTTVHILYPGTKVNPDGSIADLPGWNLNSAGFWVRDPTDAFLREGINLKYELNPTATAFITYPPESSACANPSGPFTPAETTPALPSTGTDSERIVLVAFLALVSGAAIVLAARKRQAE